MSRCEKKNSKKKCYTEYEETFHCVEVVKDDKKRNSYKKSCGNYKKSCNPYPRCQPCPPISPLCRTVCVSPSWVVTPMVQAWLNANFGGSPIIDPTNSSTTQITTQQNTGAIPTGPAAPCFQDITFYTLQDNVPPAPTAPPQIQPLLYGIQLKGNERRIAITFPGYATSALDMFRVAQFLQQFRPRMGSLRYDRILLGQTEYLHYNNIENATILMDQLRPTLQANPRIRIDIFVHSAGASNARYMMEVLGLGQFVDKFVSMGGANWCVPPDLQIGGILAASFGLPGCVITNNNLTNCGPCTENNANQPNSCPFFSEMNASGNPWFNVTQYFAIAGTIPNDARGPPEDHSWPFGPLVDQQYKLMFGPQTISDGTLTVENVVGAGLYETKSAYTAANPGFNAPLGSRRTTTMDHITVVGTALDYTGGRGYHYLSALPPEIVSALTDFLNI